jgi:putative sugar O-methyltransferase
MRLIQKINNLLFKQKNANFEESDESKFYKFIDNYLNKNENYDIQSFEEGFKCRLKKNKVDSKIFERVVNSYIKAKEKQKSVNELLMQNNEWTIIYQTHLNEIIKALSTRDLIGVQRIYENFWRDPCSTGLVGLPLDMKKHYFIPAISNNDKLVALRDGIWRFHLWKKLAGKNAKTDSLISPDIGNPFGFIYEGKFIRSGADYHHHYARQISDIVNTCKSNVVLELGGGFGGMAYYLLKENQKIKYINLDLPENMALASFYLLSALPEKNIALFGEVNIETEDLEKYDAILLPNYEFKSIKSNAVALAFNSYSLAEMSEDTIKYYISEFSRTVCDYIFHINHTVNALVVADDFGIEDYGFSRIYKAPALWNLGRNMNMDEYEYLFKKQFSK